MDTIEEYRKRKVNNRLDEIENRRKTILAYIDNDSAITRKHLSTNDYLDGMLELCGMYLEMKNMEKELKK